MAEFWLIQPCISNKLLEDADASYLEGHILQTTVLESDLVASMGNSVDVLGGSGECQIIYRLIK